MIRMLLDRRPYCNSGVPARYELNSCTSHRQALKYIVLVGLLSEELEIETWENLIGCDCRTRSLAFGRAGKDAQLVFGSIYISVYIVGA